MSEVHNPVEHPRSIQPESRLLSPDVTVASPEQIAACFPRTVYHQPDVIGTVRSVCLHDQDEASHAQIMSDLEAISAAAHEAACGLWAIVQETADQLGFGHLVMDMSARVKSPRRVADKAATSYHEGKIVPVTDVGAVQLEFAPGVSEAQVTAMAHAFRDRLGLPAMYPSGAPSIKEGGYSPERPDDNRQSQPGYRDTKVIVALAYDGRIHVGEVKFLTAEQAQLDRETRLRYEVARDERVEELKVAVGQIAIYGLFLQAAEQWAA